MIQLPLPHATVCPQSIKAALGPPLALSVSKEEAKEEEDKKAGEEEEQSELPSVLGDDGELPTVLEDEGEFPTILEDDSKAPAVWIKHGECFTAWDEE